VLFLKKCWDWCVKHWKLLLVSIGGFIAFLIGYTRASRNTQRVKLELDLQNKDNHLLKVNNAALHKASIEEIKKYEEKKAELSKQNIKSLETIELKKEETVENILNSDEKLDNILQDKWGLSKK
jgi:hypothetical protein